MSSYCCFLCPEKDYSDRDLKVKCKCGNQYGFPLFNSPQEIESFKIVKPIDRGFYSATFLAESGALSKKRVLKVIPKSIYQFFGKDFRQECQLHLEIANDTEHVVDIHNMFDTEILFGKVAVDCHVAELDYIEGKSLSKILKEKKPIKSKTIAQIAIDLFRILAELGNKWKRHNQRKRGQIF